MQKKEPQRSCIVCKNKGTKENFIKVVANKNGSVEIEKEIKLLGRGAYICKNKDCLNLCKKKRALNRVFKTEIPEKVYEELENELSKN